MDFEQHNQKDAIYLEQRNQNSKRCYGQRATQSKRCYLPRAAQSKFSTMLLTWSKTIKIQSDATDLEQPNQNDATQLSFPRVLYSQVIKMI